MEKTSSQRLGWEGAPSGAPTRGTGTLEMPQAPLRDPVRKKMRRRSLVVVVKDLALITAVA